MNGLRNYGPSEKSYFPRNDSHSIFSTGACETVASDLGSGGGFRLVFRFPPPLKIDQSQFSLNMKEKVTEIEIPKFKSIKSQVLCFSNVCFKKVSYK